MSIDCDQVSRYCLFSWGKSEFLPFLGITLFVLLAGCQRKDLLGTQSAPRATIRQVSSTQVADSQDTVRYIYQIRNLGGQDLVVGIARTTCGCTGVKVNPETIPPQGAAQVTIDGRLPAYGQRLVHVSLPTNDPLAPKLEFRLNLTRNVNVPAVSSHPIEVAYGLVRPDIIPESRRFVVDVVENRAERPSIEMLNPEPDGMKISGGIEEELLGSDASLVTRRYRYQIDFLKPPKTGPFAAQLNFGHPEKPDQPLFRVPVHGVVQPILSAVPESIFFDSPQPFAPIKKIISVVANDTRASLAVHVVADDALLRIKEVSRMESSVVYEITLVQPPKPSTPEPKIVFQIDDPIVSQVIVPVHFWMTAKGGN